MFRYLALAVLVTAIVVALWVLLGASFLDAGNILIETLG